MTVVTLTPNGTTATAGSPTVTGAANEHSALSDASDSSYVGFNIGQSATLSFGDLSLPAGAAISRLSPVVRDKYPASSSAAGYLELTAGTPRSADSWVTSWSTFTDHAVATYTPATLTDVSDSDVDGASIYLRHNGLATVLVAQLSLQVTYVAKPITDVTAPTGTISNTNTPAVVWAKTLDGDGGSQTKYEVKIFSAAQYGAGGFNPDSSTPTATSGSVISSGAFWTPTSPLPDATYRAYVRVAQSVLGSDHWSDWNYEAFTITANAPGVPTIHVVAEDDEGRVWITVDDTLGASATDAFEVQRSIDGGTTWETIRTLTGGLITPAGGVGRAYDTEVGNGQTVIYRARALNIDTVFNTFSAWSASTTATAWQSRSWWLKSPLHPDLDIPVELDGMDALEQEAGQGTFQALGRRLPIVVTDTRSGFRGTVRFIFDDADERAEFDDLLNLGEPLLLQAPATDSWDDRYVMLGNLSRARGVDKSWVDWSVETLPWTEVEAPTGDIVDWPAFAS